MTNHDNPWGHSWGYCELCDRQVVYCGRCGMNTCSGGYGTLPDGQTCDACPSAYQMDQDALSN